MKRRNEKKTILRATWIMAFLGGKYLRDYINPERKKKGREIGGKRRIHRCCRPGLGNNLSLKEDVDWIFF